MFRYSKVQLLNTSPTQLHNLFTNHSKLQNPSQFQCCNMLAFPRATHVDIPQTCPNDSLSSAKLLPSNVNAREKVDVCLMSIRFQLPTTLQAERRRELAWEFSTRGKTHTHTPPLGSCRNWKWPPVGVVARGSKASNGRRARAPSFPPTQKHSPLCTRNLSTEV